MIRLISKIEISMTKKIVSINIKRSSLIND
jgi:hypothetical protein